MPEIDFFQISEFIIAKLLPPAIFVSIITFFVKYNYDKNQDRKKFFSAAGIANINAKGEYFLKNNSNDLIYCNISQSRMLEIDLRGNESISTKKELLEKCQQRKNTRLKNFILNYPENCKNYVLSHNEEILLADSKSFRNDIELLKELYVGTIFSYSNYDGYSISKLFVHRYSLDTNIHPYKKWTLVYSHAEIIDSKGFF